MLGSLDLEKAILSFYDIDANPKTDLVIYLLLISYRRGTEGPNPRLEILKYTGVW